MPFQRRRYPRRDMLAEGHWSAHPLNYDCAPNNSIGVLRRRASDGEDELQGGDEALLKLL
jgi:hypothetical protein